MGWADRDKNKTCQPKEYFLLFIYFYNRFSVGVFQEKIRSKRIKCIIKIKPINCRLLSTQNHSIFYCKSIESDLQIYRAREALV